MAKLRHVRFPSVRACSHRWVGPWQLIDGQWRRTQVRVLPNWGGMEIFNLILGPKVVR